ncbi:MAG: ATP-binding protein [Pseudodesulfovibrio sp.]
MRENSIESFIILVAVAGCLLLGLSGLVAYIPGFEILGSVRPDYIPMAPTTSCSFVLLSIVLLVIEKNTVRTLIQIPVIITLSLVSLFGLLELVGFFLEMDLNYEDVIIPQLGLLNGVPIGRMSPSTGILFFISGLTLLCVFLSKNVDGSKKRNLRHFAGFLSCLILFSALTFVLSYVYGIPLLYDQRTIPMAITTALGFVSLSVGFITIIGREYYPLKSFSGLSTSARLRRTFIPLIIIFILIQSGGVILVKRFTGGLNEAFVAATIATLYAFIIGVVINRVSKVVGNRIDTAEDALIIIERQLAMAHKLEAVGQLASGIAHEINTPLHYVGGNLDFLNKSFPELKEALKARKQIKLENSDAERVDENTVELTQEWESALVDSIEGLNQISAIVQAMKRFSHPDLNNFRATDFNEIISNTMIVAKNEWKYVAEVELKFDSELPNISCNPGEMNQVVLILLVNAAQAIAMKNANTSEKGQITITTSQENKMLVFSVQDDGCGIPKEIIHRVYDHFFTTKEIGKGTGQGLSIANAMIEKHKGSIELDSEVGVGTTFTVRLPL